LYLRIAYVEDDLAQAELLSGWLKSKSYHYHHFALGQQFLQAQKKESFDLLIVDWELPDITGIDIVTTIRKTLDWHMPVIFTTNRNSEADIVKGLQAGADDYMTKPVRKMELFARIMALVRRYHPSMDEDKEIFFAPYTFAHEDFSVAFHETKVQLTSKEFELSLFLFRSAGRLLSRGHILESVWGQRGDLNTRTVDTHISTVRQKLKLSPQNGWHLKTIYRYGYRLDQVTTDE